MFSCSTSPIPLLKWSTQLKSYIVRQLTKIKEGRVRVSDFVFAKEVRLGSYASEEYMPPSAIVASKAMMKDPRAEPRYGERYGWLYT